jgi:hypothetical protein
MMATHEELEAAAAAFLERYLVDNSVYSTKADMASAKALGTPAAAAAGSRRSDAADAPVLLKDQGHDDIEAGTAGSAAAAAEPRGRKSWLGSQEDKEVAKTAGWFKQCRWVGWNSTCKARHLQRSVVWGPCTAGHWRTASVSLPNQGCGVIDVVDCLLYLSVLFPISQVAV